MRIKSAKTYGKSHSFKRRDARKDHRYISKKHRLSHCGLLKTPASGVRSGHPKPRPNPIPPVSTAYQPTEIEESDIVD